MNSRRESLFIHLKASAAAHLKHKMRSLNASLFDKLFLKVLLMFQAMIISAETVVV